MPSKQWIGSENKRRDEQGRLTKTIRSGPPAADQAIYSSARVALRDASAAEFVTAVAPGDILVDDAIAMMEEHAAQRKKSKEELPRLSPEGSGEVPMDTKEAARKAAERIRAEARARMTLREKLHEFVEGDAFTAAIGFVVVVNITVMGFETDLRDLEDPSPLWRYCDLTFLAIFALEALLKIAISGRRYFFSSFNLLDLGLVVLGFVEQFVVSGDDGESSQLKSLTGLRVLRMLRLVRLLRVLQMFRQLWLIAYGLLESLRMLGWIMLLFFLSCGVFAIFTTMSIGHNREPYRKFGATICQRYTTANNTKTKKIHNCQQYEDKVDLLFGRVLSGMLTLFQLSTLDSWADQIVRYILEVQPEFVPIFICFIGFVTYGLLNVALSIIIDKTLDLAKSNEEVSLKRTMREQKRVEDNLRAVFRMADDDLSGEVEPAELREALKDPECLRLLHSVELPVPDADDLFACLDVDEGGSLSEEEFVAGCKRLRGAAKNRDLLQIQVAVESANATCTVLEEDLVDTVNELGDVAGMTKNILASVDRVEEALSACGTKAWAAARERARLVDAARRQRKLVTQSPSKRNSLLQALELNGK